MVLLQLVDKEAKRELALLEGFSTVVLAVETFEDFVIFDVWEDKLKLPQFKNAAFKSVVVDEKLFQILDILTLQRLK